MRGGPTRVGRIVKGDLVDIVLLVVAAAVGFGPAFWLGHRFGVRCRKLPPSRYWIANGLGLLVGFVLAVLGAQFAMQWLWVAALGVMTGSLSGLKYGQGESVEILRLARRDSGEKGRSS
jgi:hypothetical protein